MTERVKGFGEDTVLYFAYAALLAPQQMAEVAPGTSFEFIAHLPGWGLSFEIVGNGWEGGLPTAVLAQGSTVRDAAYSIAQEELGEIDWLNPGRGAHRSMSMPSTVSERDTTS
jgi:hypothetical protein